MEDAERGYPGDYVDAVLKSLAGLVPLGGMVRFELERPESLAVPVDENFIGSNKLKFFACQIYGRETEHQ